MEILALAHKDGNSMYGFISPAYAGNTVIEVELTITSMKLEDFAKEIVCDSYSVAHRQANLTIMSEEDYEYLYG